MIILPLSSILTNHCSGEKRAISTLRSVGVVEDVPDASRELLLATVVGRRG